MPARLYSVPCETWPAVPARELWLVGCMPDGKDEGALMLSSDMALASTPCMSTSLWDGLGCSTGRHRVSGRLVS